MRLTLRCHQRDKLPSIFGCKLRRTRALRTWVHQPSCPDRYRRYTCQGSRCLRQYRPGRRRAWVPILRSVFIDHYVYTLSQLGIVVHDLRRRRLQQVVALRSDQRPTQVALDARPWR